MPQLQTCLWYKANADVDQNKFSALEAPWHFENCTAFHGDVIFLKKINWHSSLFLESIYGPHNFINLLTFTSNYISIEKGIYSEHIIHKAVSLRWRESELITSCSFVPYLADTWRWNSKAPRWTTLLWQKYVFYPEIRQISCKKKKTSRSIELK